MWGGGGGGGGGQCSTDNKASIELLTLLLGTLWSSLTPLTLFIVIPPNTRGRCLTFTNGSIRSFRPRQSVELRDDIHLD